MAAKATASTMFPSVLAFSRKFEVSDALMTSGLWGTEQWEKIALHEKRNRATFSQCGAKDEDKRKPNLSWGDDATLPHDADTLCVSFTLKVMGRLEEPTACNEPVFEETLKTAVNAYRDTHQFKELAVRYAHNIVNGRFLWRNRVGAELITIKVKRGDQVWVFDAYDYPLEQFTLPADGSDLAQLITVIQNALKGKGFAYLEITAFAKMGFGQHVWPSQEMVMNPPKDKKTKFLFQLDDCAAIHSEKIGNALRTIDTWYREGEHAPAIATEPYGSVTTKGEAYRISKNDFYTLLGKWMSDIDSVNPEQQHYIIATLIRGGFFGGKGD
ncbi:MAG: type I-F CRISPR-associated protein Csy3 [Methylococcaceae bacterium]